MSQRCFLLPEEQEIQVLGSIHHILQDVQDSSLELPVDQLLPETDLDASVRSLVLEMSQIFYDGIDEDVGLPETGVRVLNIYTMENGQQSVYRLCNAALRDRNRNLVRPWARYIAAMLEAMRRCRPHAGVLYRGMKAKWDAKMQKRFAVGKKVFFWSFSSTTASMGVLLNPQFLGTTGERVLFIIESSYAGVSLKGFSIIPNEEEVLLPPCCCFEVQSEPFQNADGLVIVTLKQVPSALELLPESHRRSGPVAQSPPAQVVPEPSVPAATGNVRVSGCEHDVRRCNGTYKPLGLRNGRQCFGKANGSPGAIYFSGSEWRICGSGCGLSEMGWDYSQSETATIGDLYPPMGSWRKSRACKKELSRDYSDVSLCLRSADSESNSDLDCATESQSQSDHDGSQESDPESEPTGYCPGHGTRRLTVGDQVKLRSQKSKLGCLRPEDMGEIVADDGDEDNQPYQVRGPDGATYWYRESEVIAARDERPFTVADVGCLCWIRPGASDGPHSGGDKVRLKKFDSVSSVLIQDPDGSNQWWLSSSVLQRWDPQGWAPGSGAAFGVGDRVRIRPVSQTEAMRLLEDCGGWVSAMDTCLGKTGKVIEVINKSQVRVKNDHDGDTWVWNHAILEDPCSKPLAAFGVGDRVRIRPVSQTEAMRLLEDCGGWVSAMDTCLGKTGKVIEVINKSQVRVKNDHDGDTWVWNRAILEECGTTGESDHESGSGSQAESDEDELPESDPESDPTGSGHSGEWRGSARSQWCSLKDQTDGLICEHGSGIIAETHWSCCGARGKSDPCSKLLAAFGVGDRVRIRPVSQTEAMRLQEDCGGWVSAMDMCLGKTGKVIEVINKSQVRVKNDHDGDTWVWNRAILEECGTTGESDHESGSGSQAESDEDELPESDPESESTGYCPGHGTRRLTVGDQVKLRSQKSKLGCLRPEDMGEIVADDGDEDNQPYQVRGPDGATYWYRESEVIAARDERPFTVADVGCLCWIRPGASDGPHSGGDKVRLKKFDSVSSVLIQDPDGSNQWWLSSSVLQRWDPQGWAPGSGAAFGVGDRVRIRPVSQTEAMRLLEDCGGWVSAMDTCLGKTGKVIEVINKSQVRVKNDHDGDTWVWNHAILEDPCSKPLAAFGVGDRVRIRPVSQTEAMRLLEDCGGWVSAMDTCLGKTGKVIEVINKSQVRVKNDHDGDTWVWNRAILEECGTTGESDHESGSGSQAESDEDELPESDPESDPTGSGHSGEWRGSARSQWCSLKDQTDGLICEHGSGIIAETHWSCCGARGKSDPCSKPLAAFGVGDRVRIRPVSQTEAMRLQEDCGGWVSAMDMCLGKTGKVIEVINKSQVRVKNDHDGDTWVWNRAILEECGTTGESDHESGSGSQAESDEDELPESDPESESTGYCPGHGTRRLTVGDQVKLRSQKSKLGCLRPEDMGEIVADDGDEDNQPYQVRGPDGATYWYRESEVIAARDERPFTVADVGCLCWIRPGASDGPHSGGDKVRLKKFDSVSSVLIQDPDGSNQWWLSSSVLQRWDPQGWAPGSGAAFGVGDRVRIRPVSQTEAMRLLEDCGGWVSAMDTCLGKTGKVIEVINKSQVRVKNDHDGDTWVWNRAILEDPCSKPLAAFGVGDRVRIRPVSQTEAMRLQEDCGGWVSAMDMCLGKTGKVIEVINKSQVRVKNDHDGDTWVWNRAILASSS